MTIYLEHGLLLLCTLWPLLVALLLVLPGSRAIMWALAPWAALPALVAALVVPVSENPTTIPGALLGSEIGLDGTAKVFLLFTSLLWLAAGAYSRWYIPRATQVRFYVFFLLTLTGNLRVIIAQDMVGFYFGYALMSFAAYGLIVFEGNAAAFRAGRVYILLMVASEIALFTAFVLAAHAAGGTSFEMVQVAVASANYHHLIIALTIGGFGVKTGLLGLHSWLPLAHSQAPTPASAVLSGAMVKVGLLGWLRMLPLGEMAALEWGTIVLAIGLIAAFYGVAIGLTQRSPKTVLAYSSISQMGIMTAAVGMALLAPKAWPMMLSLVAFYALQHGLNKGALFLGAGLGGKDHRLSHWWLWWLLMLPALALAGGPWTSGMLAKLLLKHQLPALPDPFPEVLPLLLSLGSLATALLLARFLYLMRPHPSARPRRPASGLLAPWLILLLAAQLLPWLLVPERPAFSLAKTFNSAWPIVLTALVALGVVRWGLLKKLPMVPAGDVLILGARLIKRLASVLDVAVSRVDRRQLRFYGRVMPIVHTGAEWVLAKSERGLSQWSVAIVIAIGVAVLMVWQTA